MTVRMLALEKHNFAILDVEAYSWSFLDSACQIIL